MQNTIRPVILTVLSLCGLFSVLEAQIPTNQIHIVKRGESFNSIADIHDRTINMLAENNPQIKNLDMIRRGDTIFLTYSAYQYYRNKDFAGNSNTSNLPPPNQYTPPFTSQPDNGQFAGIRTEAMANNVNKITTSEGQRYVFCKINLASFDIKMFNGNNRDRLHTLESVNKTLGNKMVFAMNGGAFHENRLPVGLFVADGQIYKSLNEERRGYGNFFNLPPNGVFFIDYSYRAHVVTTQAYKSAMVSGRYEVKSATQSGPMLVIDGQLNEAFNEGSPNLKIRNGIGVDANGDIIMVVSEVPVNFYDFSTLFRDYFNCSNALYLDGTISDYYIPRYGRRIPGMQQNMIGPIMTVVRKY